MLAMVSFYGKWSQERISFTKWHSNTKLKRLSSLKKGIRDSRAVGVFVCLCLCECVSVHVGGWMDGTITFLCGFIFLTSPIQRPQLTVEGTVPNEMKKLMEQCWAHEPRNRPDFVQIVITLADIEIKAIAAKGREGVVSWRWWYLIWNVFLFYYLVE